MESLEPDLSLGSDPGSTTSQVCDLGHMDKSPCASVLPAFKGTNDRNTEPGVKYEVFRTVPGTQRVLASYSWGGTRQEKYLLWANSNALELRTLGGALCNDTLNRKWAAIGANSAATQASLWRNAFEQSWQVSLFLECEQWSRTRVACVLVLALSELTAGCS